MLRFRATITGALIAGSALAASIIPGDARRGEQLFQSQQCVQCHSINGKGGMSAPDLSKRTGDRTYTPAGMASLMWNHAPDMWSAMQKQGITRLALTAESAADIFAYYVSARYFDRPADAARGKKAFAARHCADCHGLRRRWQAAGRWSRNGGRSRIRCRWCCRLGSTEHRSERPSATESSPGQY